MASIPKRVEDRLTAGVKKYQPFLALAKSYDVRELDSCRVESGSNRAEQHRGQGRRRGRTQLEPPASSAPIRHRRAAAWLYQLAEATLG